jgi:hypothetical protein
MTKAEQWKKLKRIVQEELDKINDELKELKSEQGHSERLDGEQISLVCVQGIMEDIEDGV